MYSIESHKINHKYVNYELSSVDGIPLPLNSTKYYLIICFLTLNFIDSWLKSFKTSYEG